MMKTIDQKPNEKEEDYNHRIQNFIHCMYIDSVELKDKQVIINLKNDISELQGIDDKGYPNYQQHWN